MAKTCPVDGCPQIQPCRIHKPKRSPSSKVTSTRRWKRFRLEILERDEWTCHYCAGPANTVDKLEAVAHGGDPYDPANAVASCGPCNFSKGAR